jgi:hypothetical protein
VTRKDGIPAVSDGPYLETKEYMASFYLIDVESEERAFDLAAGIPWGGPESDRGLADHARARAAGC